MLLTVVAAPLSGGLMLEATKGLLLLNVGGSLVSAMAWAAALLAWWLILGLLWLHRARFEIIVHVDGAPTRRKVANVLLLAALIVMASGLGLLSAFMTVSG